MFDRSEQYPLTAVNDRTAYDIKEDVRYRHKVNEGFYDVIRRETSLNL